MLAVIEVMPGAYFVGRSDEGLVWEWSLPFSGKVRKMKL